MTIGRMGSGACVLVVDDEPMVREVLTRYLERDGFAVTTAADGEAALDEFEARAPNLVLLDLMLPRLDGFEVFRRMRAARPSSPVIMLTARGDVTDRIVGLEIGADDYVAKPFYAKEVVARVRTVLRRAVELEHGGEVLRHGDLVIDARSREVTLGGRALTLTPREFDLLHYLASDPGSVHSRYHLLDALWDVAFDGDPATVTVHIRRLREKLELDPSHPRRLVTVWGAGYRFVP